MGTINGGIKNMKKSILLSIFSIPIAWLLQLSRVLSFMDNYNGDIFIGIIIVLNTIFNYHFFSKKRQ